MKAILKKYAWYLLGLMLVGISLQIYSQITWFIVFWVGVFIMCLSLFFFKKGWRYLGLGFGLFLVLTVLNASLSFYGLIIFFVFLYLLFHTESGNAFFWLNEANIHPFSNKQSYYGIALVQPQADQRSLVYKQNLQKQYQHRSSYEWHDINIVALGGDAIIDLGATILPEGESVILIRKGFGRVRVIVPRDLGLKMNISLVKGKVTYEQDQFDLLNDTFLWQSRDYQKSNRRIKIVLSSITGNVEVIRL